MAEQRGFIVYSDYTTIDNQTYIQLFGRLENGESFVILTRFQPYFFIKKEDEKQLERITKNEEFKNRLKTQEAIFTTFKEEKVIKILPENQETLNKLTKELHEQEIDTFEADI